MRAKTWRIGAGIVVGLSLAAVIAIPSYLRLQHSAANPYKNPVFQPTMADPSIIKGQDGYFYVYGTEDDWGDGHGPHLIPVIRSKNLTTWQYVTDAFTARPTWHEGGLWAPDISYFNGRYYLYYAMSVWGDMNPGIGVATSTTPTGPFHDQGKLFTSGEIGVANSIDPMVYFDNGTPYLFWGSFEGIFGIQLSKDGMHTVGSKFQIAGTAFEASYIIKHNGYYYFFGSSGTCCDGPNSGYHVAVGRSKSLRGPYVDASGTSLMIGDGQLVLMGSMPGSTNPWVGPGHIAIMQDGKGTDWMIYAAVDQNKPYLPNKATRRPLMLDKIVWKNGWPIITGMQPSDSVQQGPEDLEKVPVLAR